MSRMSYEEFYRRGILQYRNLDESRGINPFYSKFYEKLKQYYGYNINPREITDLLASEGKIETKFVKGGIMIYLPGEGSNNANYYNKRERESLDNLPAGYTRPDIFMEPYEIRCNIDDEICDEGFGIHNHGIHSPIKSCRHGEWDIKNGSPPCENVENIERKRRKLKLTLKRKPVHKIIKKKIQKKCICKKK